MCGIAGILHLDGSLCDRSDVQRITDALAHRGPDGSGIYTDGSVGLGHRRLAILDLSESGKQPMSVLDGRYRITFNGEVFNFLELRRELLKIGQTFHSETDTEVIVAAYHHWGADCVLKFNGMWAFAIWDSQRRELFLSRDRFGIKPLHYLSEPRRFVFASELKSFLHLHDFAARENEEELRRALTTRGESEEETLVQGVKLLRPGHNLLVSTSRTRIWCWWRTLDYLTDVPKRFPEQAERFRELFFDACGLRLRSDVPVATCLSGGMDSSSILCSVSALPAVDNAGGSERRTNDFHRAYVATFEGTRQDEREYAEATIAKAGADARYIAMKADTLLQDLAQYAYDFEIIGSALLLPIWAIYRALRKDGIVVSLDGHGADELLTGYEDSLRSLLKSHGSLLQAPLRTLDVVSSVTAMEPGTGWNAFARLLVDSDPFLRRVQDTARRARRPFKSAPVMQVKKDPQWTISSTATAGPEMDNNERLAMNTLSPLNRQLYWMFHHGVLQSILRKYDRLSMAHGVEIRMPFMDWRLVCYAFSLPDESKVGGGYTKRVLREAMRGVLPEKVRTRKTKLGFVSPIENWLNGDLGDWVWERVNTKRFLESDVWNGPAIRDFIAPRQSAKNWTRSDALRVWMYVQADLWREAFFGSSYGVRSSAAVGDEIAGLQ